MFRATYFVLTTEVPASVWEIELPPLAPLHGLGALGMLGVVFSAIRRGPDQGGPSYELFDEPEDVAAIFGLEEEGPLSVQLEDVWIPKQWCVDTPVWGSNELGDGEPARGDVFRVALALFQEAYRYTTGDIDLEELAGQDPAGRVFSSPEETRAMRAWAEGLIEETKRAFPAKDGKLRYRSGESLA